MCIKPALVFVSLILLSFWFTKIVADETTLIFSVHPYKQSTVINNSFSPLVKYLSDKTSRSFELRISKDYQSHIDLIGNDQVDIAYMGPASYVKLVDTFGKKRLLTRLEVAGKPTFQGVIIIRRDSDISSLKMLQGKRFAFGSPSSTMSHLVPRYMMISEGITVEQLGKYAFLGNHANVALGVLAGNYDAGAVKEAVFQKYKSKGLKKLAMTPKLSEHLFIVNNKMDNKLVNEIKTLMLDLHLDSNGIEILQSIKKSATALVSVKDSDYDNLRDIIKRLRHLDPTLK